MKIKFSLVTRRRFLNSLIGGWFAAIATSLAAPVIRFLLPPYKEPDEVLLDKSPYENIPLNSVKTFAWGAKPGLLKRNEDGSFTAFLGVCTHLDCNVSYLPDQKKFFCACHKGWYDENGINIAGPPPAPLRRLGLQITEENFIIMKEKGKTDIGTKKLV